MNARFIAVLGLSLAFAGAFAVNDVMGKELDLKGAFRWGIEFDWAVDYLSSRRVDVKPLLSGQFALQDAVEAFALAKDKTRSTKVQVVAA